MKHLLFFTFLLFAVISLEAQNLPPQMRLSVDRHQLITGDQAPGGLYDSAAIRSIYLDFSQPNFWTLLTNNYQSKTDLPAKMTVNGEAYDSVGVRFKGQTSYMMAQNSQKKSFNLTIDYARPDQKLMGYKTLNLNNSFQDPSFLREVFYLHQIRRHIPAAKANFVKLYLNGQYWGIYPNVQQLNKDFLREWFFSADGINWRADRPDGTVAPGPGGGGGGWGDGTAALNYLGSDTAQYQKYYTLKSSELDRPWDYLVATCNALNNTPAAELPDVLPDYLDVDRTLWHLATEIAFSDDDSYVYKGKMDYYVYYEPETGRMTPLEYDGNSVMEMNFATWSPFYNASKVNYPLLNKILTVPMWRQRYLAHLRTIIEDELDPARCNAMLDNFKSMIDSLVKADTKKSYTNTQFDTELSVLKNFISSRRTNLLNNTEVKQIAPVIETASLQNMKGEVWKQPLAGEEAAVTAKVSSGSGIFGVNLFYSTKLTGNFTPLQMHDDGLHHDGAAGDGLYGAAMPGQIAGTWVRFYVEAVANNTARSASYLPKGAEHDVFVYQVEPQSLLNGPVVINELMASNTTTVTDEQGDYDDWIELYNTSNQAIDLSGYYLSDNPANLAKYEIPQGVSIPANGYLIFWADEDGVDGPVHANFKLSADGEVLFLLNPNLVIMDSVTFGIQTADKSYSRIPNGTGNFVIKAPTFNQNNETVVAVSEADMKPEGMLLFPNPAMDAVHIKLNEIIDNQPIVIWDITGRAVLRQIPDGPVTRIPLQQWPAGFYAVQYGAVVRKLSIQR